MESSNLTSLLERAVAESSNDAEAFLKFTESYQSSLCAVNQELNAQLQKTQQELSDTKDMAKKLAEGVKKYKGALNNLQKVLSSANED